MIITMDIHFSCVLGCRQHERPSLPFSALCQKPSTFPFTGPFSSCTSSFSSSLLWGDKFSAYSGSANPFGPRIPAFNANVFLQTHDQVQICSFRPWSQDPLWRQQVNAMRFPFTAAGHASAPCIQFRVPAAFQYPLPPSYRRVLVIGKFLCIVLFRSSGLGLDRVPFLWGFGGSRYRSLQTWYRIIVNLYVAHWTYWIPVRLCILSMCEVWRMAGRDMWRVWYSATAGINYRCTDAKSFYAWTAWTVSNSLFFDSDRKQRRSNEYSGSKWEWTLEQERNNGLPLLGVIREFGKVPFVASIRSRNHQ